MQGAATLTATTPAAKTDVGRVTWALYRETSTLDPLFAFDTPDNTVLSTLCDSLLRQQPDGAIAPGLAASFTYRNPRTIVLGIRDGVRFWDGSKLTADDVVYSLDRQRDPKLGGLYGHTLDRVTSIEASGPLQVTIKLSAPDYWLRGELASTPGEIVSKRVAEREGAKYGTPGGTVMCTGPYKLKSWKPGDAVSVVRNDDYWDASLRARTRQIDFKGIPDESTLTSGLLTGEVGGDYPISIGTLAQLRDSNQVNVQAGPSYATDAVVVSSLTGALGDVRVRRALSLALDRQGIIRANFNGMAQLPRALGNPGAWGYGRDVFQAAWDARTPSKVDLAAARKLIRESGASGKTVVFGMTNEVKVIATEANALRSAAEAIGLNVKLKAVSSANYIGFFVDPKVRAGVDAFFTMSYPDYADPAPLYATIALKGGTENYSGFSNPGITRLLNEARSTADPEARAKLVVQAEELLNEQLPWIPVSAPDSLLLLDAKLTGAPASFAYMSAPWLAALGGKG